MTQATGGIISTGKPHVIGNEGSPCPPFPDSDYTLDTALMIPEIVDKVKSKAAGKSIDEQAEMLREELKIWGKTHKELS